MSEAELDVLGLLIRHELTIKHLYEIFSTMFTERKALWENLATAEQRHADWLISLQPDSSVSKWLMRESTLKPKAIKSSIEYVESQITRANEGSMSLLQALSISIDIEKALLERQYSKLKDSSIGGNGGAVMTNICNETEEHQKTLVELINSEKR